MSAADPISQLEAAARQHASTGAADAELWVAVSATLREIRDGVIAEGRPILTVPEACQLVNVGSLSALQRWCATWKVRPSGHGRYPRRALLAGLDREANAVIPRRRTPARSASLSQQPPEQLAA